MFFSFVVASSIQRKAVTVDEKRKSSLPGAKREAKAKALAADSQLQEEPSSSSLGSTQMGLSADTVKDGSQTVQFFATVDDSEG